VLDRLVVRLLLICEHGIGKEGEKVGGRKRESEAGRRGSSI
jgi:hypothetical protein